MYPNDRGAAGAAMNAMIPAPPGAAREVNQVRKESRFHMIAQHLQSVRDQLQSLVARAHGVADALAGQQPKEATESSRGPLPSSDNFSAQLENDLVQIGLLLNSGFAAIERLERL
jgi:hypothetical protein